MLVIWREIWFCVCIVFAFFGACATGDAERRGLTAIILQCVCKLCVRTLRLGLIPYYSFFYFASLCSRGEFVIVFWCFPWPLPTSLLCVCCFLLITKKGKRVHSWENNIKNINIKLKIDKKQTSVFSCGRAHGPLRARFDGGHFGHII